MPNSALVSLTSVSLRHDAHDVLSDIELDVFPKEVLRLQGGAGSGKSTLLEVLLGRHRLRAGKRSYPAFAQEYPDAQLGIPPRFAIRLVSDAEQRRVAAEQSTFYQARWHSLWTDPHTVDEFLEPARVMGLRPYEIYAALPVRLDFAQERERGLDELELANHRAQAVGQLSNGELRKLLLLSAHLAAPRILLLDDPLGGLDPNARRVARDAILRWIAEGQTLVFCSAQDDELSQAATRCLMLQAGRLVPNQLLPAASGTTPPELKFAPPTSPITPSGMQPETMLECHDLRVTAGDRCLLHDVNWQIQRGEHWMVTGPNGAGKSTLLALLTGDHPQAYSNRVEILGRRLGQSTNLWERRRLLGFVAPELGWHYPSGWCLADVVLSGLDDSIGIHREPSVAERQLAELCLTQIGLLHRASAPMATLSESQRRLVLLARAAIKRPPLLLLDEPTQGLGPEDRLMHYAQLDELAREDATTLVLVTHHPDERPQCITHHLQLADGGVVSCGRLQR